MRFKTLIIFLLMIIEVFDHFIFVYGQNPNILFVMIDDLRPAIGVYGDSNAITPNIDKLAMKSYQFTEVYAQQSLCAPSRNSMLTGRRPDTLRLYDFYSYWRHTIGNFTTLPQYLKEHGYETHSIGKIFHPGESSNYTDDYPYSWTKRPWHSKTETFMNKPVCVDNESGNIKMNIICPVIPKYQPYGTLPDIDSIRIAKKFIKKRRRLQQSMVQQKSWFLAIGLHKPHIPFKFPMKYLKLHPLEKFTKPSFDHIPYGLPTVAYNPYTDIRERDDVKRENISFPFGPIPKDFGYRLRQGYYSSVTFIDHLIGNLLKTVNYSNTIILLTSDHGWSLGEHAVWAKYSNYNVALNVPLIIYIPTEQQTRFNKKSSANNERQQQQQRESPIIINNIIELIDIFPSVIDIIGLPKIPKCSNNSSNIYCCTEGKSFINYMSNVVVDDELISMNETYAFSQYPRPGKYPTVHPNSDKPKSIEIQIMGYSIRTKQFRYTIWIQFNGHTFEKDWNKIYGEELYDHSIDSAEMLNLAERIQFNEIKLNLLNLLKSNFI